MIRPHTQWIGGSYEAACGIMPTTVQKLLAAIRKHPGCTTADLSMTTGINVKTAYQALIRMRNRAEVTPVKSRPFSQQGYGQVYHWYSSDHKFH